MKKLITYYNKLLLKVNDTDFYKTEERFVKAK